MQYRTLIYVFEYNDPAIIYIGRYTLNRRMGVKYHKQNNKITNNSFV